MVESQPSKLLVAGSIPVSRSISKFESRNSKIETSYVGDFEFRVSILSVRSARGEPM